MTTVLEMAEAHLLNVQREIQTLEQRKLEIDEQISKLTEYLQGGVQTVDGVKSEAQAALTQDADTSSDTNNYDFEGIKG